MLFSRKSTSKTCFPSLSITTQKSYRNIYIYVYKHRQRYIYFFFQAKLETKALKAKRPGFTDDRYTETSYYVENGESNITGININITQIVETGLNVLFRKFRNKNRWMSLLLP